LLGVLVRIWARTWRTELRVDPDLPASGQRVYAFWHGRQMPLAAAARRSDTAVLVSHSRDGDLQRSVLRSLGLCVLRGSTSRGGAEGLRRMLRALRQGRNAAFAVDGPRGPRGRVKPGARWVASRAGARLVPVGVAASRTVVLRRTWDEFEIPLPFARVCVFLGAPVTSGRLDRAIDRATEQARCAFER
jgi:lysophospholipid acyltransferase (LPLAT)-like uncharacterized protein